MSALGQKQTSRRVLPMSALPPKADIADRQLNVRFVPLADIAATLRYVDDSASELTARRARGPQVLVDLDSLRQRRHPLELHGDHRLFLRSPVVGSASDPTPIAAKPS